MESIFIVFLTVTGAALAGWLVYRITARPKPSPRRPSRGAAAPGQRAAQPAPTASPVALPPEIAALQLARADSLDPARSQALVDTFSNLPRPPRLLSQLATLDLMGASSSQDLMAMVSSEPLIAAKVLGAVNSPAYGLGRPVSSVGQAVTFLGLNSVRAVCMQYALMRAFQADTQTRAKRLSAQWLASALAGEMCQHPMNRVGLPDPSGMTSAVVLSFLGSLAVTVGLPQAELDTMPSRDSLQRTRAEQARWGVAAAEIGRLLMTRWELPQVIVDEAADISQGLVLPFASSQDVAALRRAFAHLCVCLAERMAFGELTSLAQFELVADQSLELACARSFLVDARFATLVAELRNPALVQRVAQLMGAAPRVPVTAPSAPSKTSWTPPSSATTESVT
jgi:HD-like signal output (HDOD) protein